MTADVLFEQLPGNQGDIGVITLNRPNVLNALNHDMVNAMLVQLKDWQSNDSIKAVVIKANGDRAFCAGGDLRHTHTAMEAFFRDEYLLNQQIFHFPKPYIALLDGITMGGGVGISLHGSHRVVSEKILFAMPETGIGFFPDVGGTYFLPRLPQHAGYYLGLTGARLKSDDCVILGIAQYKVPHSQFNELCNTLANTVFSDDANQSVSNVIHQFAVTTDVALLAQHMLQLDNWFAKQTVEEIIEALQASNNPFADDTIKMLEKKSPTSLKVSLAAMQRGQHLDFDDCMKMEFQLTCRFLQEHDFKEGVRAVIIDKDQNPQWNPPSLAAVTPSAVAAYF